MSEVEQEGQPLQGVSLPIDTQDACTKYPHSTTLPEISDNWTNEEELEWDSLFAQPHVQAGLNRLAKETEQQFAHGEFEEGGFAVY